MKTAEDIAEERGLEFNEYGVAVDEYGNEYRHINGEVIIRGEEYDED